MGAAMRYNFGDHVVTIETKALKKKDAGKHAVVLSEVNRWHCWGVPVYSIEFFAGRVVDMCACSIRKTPDHRTMVEWSEGPWQPRQRA